MITFFPTYAQWIETTGVWRARIHGMITRPLPAASRRRTVAYAVVKRLLKMDEEQFLSPVFLRSKSFAEFLSHINISFEKIGSDILPFRYYKERDKLFSGELR